MLPQSTQVTLMIHGFHLAYGEEQIRCVHTIAGFRAAIGAHVPDAIRLEPIPATLAALIPATKDLEVAMVEKQVILVEPRSKTIVAVATQAN